MIRYADRIADMHEAAGDYHLAAINRMTDDEKHTALVYLSWVDGFESALRFVMEQRRTKANRLARLREEDDVTTTD